MAAGLVALGDDRVAAVIGKPLCLAGGGGGGHHLGAAGLDAIQQAALRQAEMEADDLRLELLDDLAGDVIEGLAIDRGHGLCGIDGELFVVSGQPRLPLRLAGGVGLRRLVGEEVQVQRLCGPLANDAEVLADLLRARSGAGEGAEAARFGHGDRQFRRTRAGHGREDDRMLDAEEIDDPAVGPHCVSPETAVSTQ